MEKQIFLVTYYVRRNDKLSIYKVQKYKKDTVLLNTLIKVKYRTITKINLMMKHDFDEGI